MNHVYRYVVLLSLITIQVINLRVNIYPLDNFILLQWHKHMIFMSLALEKSHTKPQSAQKDKKLHYFEKELKIKLSY